MSREMLIPSFKKLSYQWQRLEFLHLLNKHTEGLHTTQTEKNYFTVDSKRPSKDFKLDQAEPIKAPLNMVFPSCRLVYRVTFLSNHDNKTWNTQLNTPNLNTLTEVVTKLIRILSKTSIFSKLDSLNLITSTLIPTEPRNLPISSQ